jgi:hypothetical protein
MLLIMNLCIPPWILQKSLRNWPSIVFLPKRSKPLPPSPRDLFIYFPKLSPCMPRRPSACHAIQKSPTHAFHANIIRFTPWHTPSACHSASHASSFRCKSHRVLIYLRSMQVGCVQCVEVRNYASQNSSIACHATILRDTPKSQRPDFNFTSCCVTRHILRATHESHRLSFILSPFCVLRPALRVTPKLSWIFFIFVMFLASQANSNLVLFFNNLGTKTPQFAMFYLKTP